MVRIMYSEGKYTGQEPPVYCEFSGKSTDTKPTGGIMTGSTFLEVNTADLYLYDEEGAAGEEWIKAGGSSDE